MSLTARERKALVGQSHRLKPLATFDAANVSDATAMHVRNCFADHQLIKIRLHADSGAACDAAAAELADRVPCEIVKRIGRVVLLYRDESGNEPDNHQPSDPLGDHEHEDD